HPDRASACGKLRRERLADPALVRKDEPPRGFRAALGFASLAPALLEARFLDEAPIERRPERVGRGAPKAASRQRGKQLATPEIPEDEVPGSNSPAIALGMQPRMDLHLDRKRGSNLHPIHADRQ